MTNQNSRRQPDRRKALDLVEEWLHIETLAHPKRRSGLHPNSAYQKSQPLYKTQIPKAVETFQGHIDYFLGSERTDERKSLLLGKLMLGAVCDAQHGFILGKIARKTNIITAMDDSWHLLQGFKQHVRANNVQLPDAEMLKLPIEDGIKEYTGHAYGHYVHTYVGMVAFGAVAALQLKDHKTNQFILPAPGLLPDHLERWDYDPSAY